MSGVPEVPQPRFFWRRLLALFVDWVFIALLTTLIFLPFLQPDENGIRLGGAPLTLTSCKNLISVPQEVHDLVAPEQIAKAGLCEVRPFGIYNGRTLNLVYALNEERSGRVTTSTSRTLSFSVDKQGLPIRTFTPQSILVPLLLMLASAMFLARNVQTPGKRLAGIRVVGEGCAMCRELRRLWPLVVLGGISFGFSATPPSALATLAQAPAWTYVAGGLGVFVLSAFFYIALYIWPMIRWRGAMPHDRATGFEVMRAK